MVLLLNSIERRYNHGRSARALVSLPVFAVCLPGVAAAAEEIGPPVTIMLSVG